MNCERSAYALDEPQEAVDVAVVERGLDLVQDVERARAREEHGEQEAERDERLLAAGQQRQALRRSCRPASPRSRRRARLRRRRRPRLPTAADASPSRRSAPSPARTPNGGLARSASSASAPPKHRLAAAAAYEPQPAAAAREQVPDHLLEVARGDLEGLLEALADAAVGLADQRRAARPARPRGPCAASRAPRRARAPPRTRARRAG